MARREVTGNWTRDDRIAINENFRHLFEEYTGAGLNAKEAREKAHDAVMKSDEALALSERTQKELSQAILEGDSSPLGGQLSVGADGTIYSNPQDRLVKEFNSVNQQLAQKASKEELDALPTNIMSKRYKQKRTATFNPTIVAYGDSNTRYYEGDAGKDGSVSLAYSTVIDKLTMNYPNYYESIVINAGYSGRTIQYGLDNYATNVIGNNADIVIIGFGTNDIKVIDNTLEDYIAKMEQMIDRLLRDGVVPIILGIPWYDKNYAPGTETRIPDWNEALMNLCVSKNVEFIDVYNMFKSDMADIWFNEVTTPKRHYSIMAQKVLGEEIFKRILELNNITPTRGEYRQGLFDASNVRWFNTISRKLGFRTYALGTDSIDCIELLQGESISFNVQGRYLIGFYPREDATVNVSPIGDINITAETSDGLYYPVLKVADSFNLANARTKAVTTVTITATTGNAYIRFITSEFLPRNYRRGNDVIEKVVTDEYSYEIYTDGSAKVWGIRTIDGVNTSASFGGLKRNSGGNYGVNSPLNFSKYTYANYRLIDAPTYGIVLNASGDFPHNFQLAFASDLSNATVKVAWELRGIL